MGGTALADWATAKDAQPVTFQISQALNCPLTKEFAECLRKRRINDIMNSSATTDPFKTRFGPVVDGKIVPNDPRHIMTNYSDLFKRYRSPNLAVADSLTFF